MLLKIVEFMAHLTVFQLSRLKLTWVTLKMIRSPHKPFAQLVKRIEERNEQKRRVPQINDMPTIQTIEAGTKNEFFEMEL